MPAIRSFTPWLSAVISTRLGWNQELHLGLPQGLGHYLLCLVVINRNWLRNVEVLGAWTVTPLWDMGILSASLPCCAIISTPILFKFWKAETHWSPINPLVHSPDAWDTQSLARLKPDDRSSFQASRMGGRDPSTCPPPAVSQGTCSPGSCSQKRASGELASGMGRSHPRQYCNHYATSLPFSSLLHFCVKDLRS